MSVAVAERFEGFQLVEYIICVLARCLEYLRLSTEVLKLFDAFNKNFKCYLGLNNLWWFVLFTVITSASYFPDGSFNESCFVFRITIGNSLLHLCIFLMWKRNVVNTTVCYMSVKSEMVCETENVLTESFLNTVLMPYFDIQIWKCPSPAQYLPLG